MGGSRYCYDEEGEGGDEARSRRRWSGEPTSRCSHWSNLRDHGAHTILSFCTRGDLALWRVRIERQHPRLSSSLYVSTRAGSRMHRIRVKGTGYFLRGTFGIFGEEDVLREKYVIGHTHALCFSTDIFDPRELRITFFFFFFGFLLIQPLWLVALISWRDVEGPIVNSKD